MSRHDNRKRPLPKPTETPLTLESWKDRHFPDMPQVAWEQLNEIVDGAVKQAKIDEGAMWLTMLVRNDHSRLDSGEWYKINPRDVAKYASERLDQLTNKEKE